MGEGENNMGMISVKMCNSMGQAGWHLQVAQGGLAFGIREQKLMFTNLI